MDKLKRTNITKGKEELKCNPLPSNDCCPDYSIDITKNKYGHIVVQNLQELYAFPCKLRTPGMSATVVEENYAEFQLKATTESKCNNNNWQVAEGGGLWKYIPIPEEEAVGYTPEEYLMYTFGVGAEAGMFYHDRYKVILERMPFEEFKALLIESFEGNLGITYLPETDEFLKVNFYTSQEEIVPVPTNIFELFKFNYIVATEQNLLNSSRTIPFNYLKELQESTEENFGSIAFKVSELMIVMRKLYETEYLGDYSIFADYNSYSYDLNFDQPYEDFLQEELDALQVLGLPASIMDWESPYLRMYDNPDISLVDKAFYSFAFVIGEIFDFSVYALQMGGEYYRDLTAEFTYGLTIMIPQMLEMGYITAEDAEYLRSVDFYSYNTESILGMAYFMKLYLTTMLMELPAEQIPGGGAYILYMFPEDIPGNAGDGDYIENIQGKSARMKDGYRITHARDLITKEYYQNNMPDIPEGNLLIFDSYSDYWDYIESSPDAKVGQLVYNNEEDRYFTIVDNGNGYLEYKEFSPALEYDVTSTVDVGAITQGQILYQGMTFTQFVTALVDKIYKPTYVAPTFTSSNNAGTREVGETFNMTITVNFNRGAINGDISNGIWNPGLRQNNRAGAVLYYTIAGTNTNSTASRTLSTTATASAQSFTSSVEYATGPTPINSNGTYLYDETLPGGSMSANTSYTGYYRRFSGPVATAPTNGTTLRTALLSTSVLNTTNSFSMATGTTNRIFVIAVPPGKTLSRVVNQNTNQDLTANFVLSTSITTVPNAAGTNVTGYKVYIMTNDVPFTANQTLNITLA